MRTKRDPKQLRAVDVSLVLGTYVSNPTAEQTALALVKYFQGGGISLRYEDAISLAIGVLSRHMTAADALARISAFKTPESREQCRQVFKSILEYYEPRVGTCIPIRSRLVKIRAGIGVHLPAAMLAKVDGNRRFVIVQPRRGRAPSGDRAGLYLSMFNEKYSVDEEYGVLAEILDLQCPKRSSKRDVRVISSEQARKFSKKELDSKLSVYADAMERLMHDPVRYGVRPDISRVWQTEMDDIW